MTLFEKEYQFFLDQKSAISVEKVWKSLSVVIIAFILLGILLLIYVPWVQTSYGTGKITALYPEDRIQTINALVSGRISHWHIKDGDKIQKGDPIVEIIDNDPQYFERLKSKRDAIKRKLSAAQRAAKTSKLNLNRQKKLFKKGLSSEKDYEKAIINYENYKAKAESIKADLAKYEIDLSRQNTQMIYAPQDGTILNILADDISSFVKTGTSLATFIPAKVEMAVELYISSLDGPLVYPGRSVQLIFEGWPAIQASGWPSVSKGTFQGQVYFVDPALSENGKIRVLATPTLDPNEEWPSSYFLRMGTRAKGWILLDQVPIGYEIWRRMNGFPVELPKHIDQSFGKIK